MRLLLLCLGATCFAAELSGVWEFNLVGGQTNAAQRVTVAQKDGKYSFKFMGVDMAATVDGSTVRLTGIEDGKEVAAGTGRVTAEGMAGDGTIEGLPMTWSARRPTPPPASPKQ